MQTFFKFLAAIVLGMCAQTSFAQTGSLTGSLQDEKGLSIPYANVAVLRSTDSTMVTGSVTDAEGKFKIASPAQGYYFMRLTAIGYRKQTVPAFTITGPEFSKDFGSIALKEDVEVLQEVSVEAQRPTVIAEADKLVVSVEGTAMAAGSTALEVLGKSPGVWVDQEGNIQLNGKSGVKVMIDGRPTYLSARELQNMLASMPAENIKNIEVIANPSAREEAEGTAGILNINLKKNTIQGMNGSVYTGFQYNGVPGYSTGASLNYKKDRWNSSINVDVANRESFKTLAMIREFNQAGDYARFDQDTYESRTDYTPSIKLGTTYELNKNHSLGFNTRLSQHRTEQDFSADMSLVRTNADDNMLIKSATPSLEKINNSTLNLNYLGKLDSAGTTLSANLDYVRLRNNASTRFLNTFTDANGNVEQSQALGNKNPTSYDIYAARLDFSRPLSKGKLELGLKASHVTSDNELDFYAMEGNIQQPVADMSNHFIYRENILAAYTNWNRRLNDTWNVQAGLRAEQTISEGESYTTDQKTSRSYLNLFPSLFVQQKVSDNYQLSYNYSRRINRPRYEALNPYFVYLDPYTVAQGNPHLRPEYTHSFEVIQTIKQSYNLILGYSISEDYSTEIPMQNNETKRTVFVQQNFDRQQTMKAVVVAPVQVLPKWSIFNNLIMAYQSFETNIGNLHQVNESLFFMAQTNNTIKLPAGFTFELSGTYRGPLAHGLYQIDGAWWVNTGIKRSFMDNKLDVSLSANDIFGTLLETGTADIGVNRNYFEQYRGVQDVRINLRYRFSKGAKFESKNKSSELEELNRTGGN